MLVELMDEKIITEVHESKFSALLEEALIQNKTKIVDCLFDSGKIELVFADKFIRNNANISNDMQEVLKKYQQKYEKEKQKIDDAVKIISEKTMDGISPINKPAGDTQGGIFALSDDEYKITQSIIFLADELKKNPSNQYLITEINSIKIPYVDNIYARCSNGKCVIPAMQVLAK